MHSQLFYPASNADGYVSVICHRDRYLKELLAMGWFETADEARANKLEFYQDGNLAGMRPAAEAAAKDPLDVFCERLQDEIAKDPLNALTPDGDEPDFTIGQVVAPPANPGERSGADGLSKSQRKKLRLNK